MPCSQEDGSGSEPAPIDQGSVPKTAPNVVKAAAVAAAGGAGAVAATAGAAAAGSAPAGPLPKLELFSWAQCDTCSKWRRLPPGHEPSEDALWECLMSPERSRNTCEAAEEVLQVHTGCLWVRRVALTSEEGAGGGHAHTPGLRRCRPRHHHLRLCQVLHRRPRARRRTAARLCACARAP